jgi:hypothetical protein
MKHIKHITAPPRKAETEASTGDILSLIAQILTVIATALVAKESGSTE